MNSSICLLPLIGILALVLDANAQTDTPPLCTVEQQKFVASDAAGGDEFGSSVAIQGSMGLVVGGGVVYAFERSGLSWNEADKLVPNDGQLIHVDSQGAGPTVALDGSTAVAGAASAPTGGAVYVFVHDGMTWSQQQKLQDAGGAAGDAFGAAVALDGDTLLVGAFGDDEPGPTGSAFVFVRTGTSWSQQAQLLPPSGALFAGFSVALDGDTAVVGSPFAPVLGSATGAVYVYQRSGTTWSFTQTITDSSLAPLEYFGHSVALDGGTLLIGARADDGVVSTTGTATVYTRIGSAWFFQQKLMAADGFFADSFGWSVWVDGDTALIGARSDDDQGLDSGSAYVFRRSGASWSQETKLTAADGEGGDLFGWSVARDGRLDLIGANREDQGGADAGAGYLFEGMPAPMVLCTAKVNSQLCTPQIAFSGTPGLSQPQSFDISASNIINQKPGLFFYGLLGRANIPFLGGVLCAIPPLKRTPIQFSGGNPPPADCTGSLTFDFNAWLQAGSDGFLAPGVVVNGQFFYRDPAIADGTGAGLSDAVEFGVCP